MRVAGLADREEAVEARTYAGKLTDQGWPDGMAWSTFFVHPASDLSFPGVVALMALIGFGLGLTWRDTLVRADPLACGVAFHLCILVFYLPANNQLFQGGELAIGFTVLVGAWLAFRRRSRPRRSSHGRRGSRLDERGRPPTGRARVDLHARQRSPDARRRRRDAAPDPLGRGRGVRRDLDGHHHNAVGACRPHPRPPGGDHAVCPHRVTGPDDGARGVAAGTRSRWPTRCWSRVGRTSRSPTPARRPRRCGLGLVAGGLGAGIAITQACAVAHEQAWFYVALAFGLTLVAPAAGLVAVALVPLRRWTYFVAVSGRRCHAQPRARPRPGRGGPS